MIRFYSILVAGLLATISMNAMANINIIFSTVPPTREVFVPPRGFVTCHNVAVGYYNGVWMNQHRVCEYSRNRGVWISGHWQCARLSGIGMCKRWDWVPSHWENPRAVAYYPPMPSARPYGQPVVASAPAVVPRPPMPVPVPQQPAAQPVPVPAGAPQPVPAPIGGPMGQPAAQAV